LARRAPEAVSLSDHHARDLQAAHAQELRVFLGDESDNNLCTLSSRGWDFSPFEQKAASLREVLLEKGWTQLAS